MLEIVAVKEKKQIAVPARLGHLDSQVGFTTQCRSSPMDSAKPMCAKLLLYMCNHISLCEASRKFKARRFLDEEKTLKPVFSAVSGARD